MDRVAIFALALALVGAQAARAADQPIYQAEPPRWVRPAPIPFDMKPSGAAADLLLWTHQSRLGPGVTETFTEQAARINAPEGLQDAGNLIQTWDPATETLTIHRARILRGGVAIDLLADGRRFTVLRRETDLEAAAVDGELTATLQPEGLRVGDVLDLAVTVARREPALAGRAEQSVYSSHSGSVGRLLIRAAWPAGDPVRVWKTDDLPALTPKTQDGWTTVELDRTEAVSPDPPRGASVFDQLAGVLAFSDFKTWADVSATVHPLFAKATELAPDSPLRGEIDRIRAASPDPKRRALAALELVEGQVRYFYVGLDAGGFVPAPADLTWKRRFGDCKGKTALLLSLLQGLGIKAEAALVDTAAGDGLDRRLPQLEAFDHVIVRAEIGGRTYWLDATRQGDENLDVLPTPNLHWALPLRAGGAGLEPLAPAEPALPLLDVAERVDLHGGLDKPAHVGLEWTLRGDAALALNLALKQASRADADKMLKRMLVANQGWITPDTVSFAYDPQKMEGRAALEGSGKPPFLSQSGAAGGVRDWVIEGGELGYSLDLTRTSDYHRDAPYVLAYPSYARVLVEVELPEAGKNFQVLDADSIDRTIGGVAFSRAAAIAGGKLTVLSSSRATAQSFPASEAQQAEEDMRSLQQFAVALRYDPADAQAAPRPTEAPAPTDPAALARQAFSEKDYARAETEFTRALAAHPTGKLHYNRAVVRLARGETALARADLQDALRLDPHEAYARLALGRLALEAGDAAGAAAWFAGAETDAARPAWIARMIGDAYAAAGRYAEAIPHFDRAAAAETEPDRQAKALNAACWTRAEAGVQLQDALQRCDAALKLRPDAVEALDSRALVELRLGAPGKAVADYTAVLARRPGSPTTLYGRGLAEAKLGRADQAQADLAAARVLDAGIGATFAGWGLKP